MKSKSPPQDKSEVPRWPEDRLCVLSTPATGTAGTELTKVTKLLFYFSNSRTQEVIIHVFSSSVKSLRLQGPTEGGAQNIRVSGPQYDHIWIQPGSHNVLQMCDLSRA